MITPPAIGHRDTHRGNGLALRATVSCCLWYGAETGDFARGRAAIEHHRGYRGGGTMTDDTHLASTPRPLPPSQRSGRRPSVAQAVRRVCLECLGATNGRGAFDCGSELCPLRPASPFMGKSMPEGFRGPSYPGEPPVVPKRRPSRRLVHAQCRQCQPGDSTDCAATECALHPYRPWPGPGHAPRRKASPAQREAAARATAASLRARGHATAPERNRQRASTATGRAFDG